MYLFIFQDFTMGDLLDILFHVVDRLDKKSLKRFQVYLTSSSTVGLKPIPEGLLNLDTTETVVRMIEAYGKENVLKITKHILRKMNRNDLMRAVDDWMKDSVQR